VVIEVAYLPKKRKTAAPMAKIPVRMPQMEPPRLMPNAERPANKKKRIMNHTEIVLGIFILQLLFLRANGWQTQTGFLCGLIYK
jgi:hypothetical protein